MALWAATSDKWYLSQHDQSVKSIIYDNMRNSSLQKNVCKLGLEPIESVHGLLLTVTKDRNSHHESHRGVAYDICGNASSHLLTSKVHAERKYKNI